MLSLPLIPAHAVPAIRNKLLETPKGRRRNRLYIDILQEIQPPKVSRSEIKRWWGTRAYQGIDADREGIIFSTRIKRKRKTELSVKRLLKSHGDHPSKKQRYRKNLKEVTGPPAIQELKKVANVRDHATKALADQHPAATTLSKRKNEFLQNMTVEQFRLMKKHGWQVARALTEPQQNFHEDGGI